MSKFRKKPVVVEAEQFPGIPIVTPEQLATGRFDGIGERTDRLIAFEDWLEPHARHAGRWPCKYKGRSLIIPTLEGDHEAQPGDWIIVGVAGEIYPCKPDIFAATYEPADA
jgi:hypothetical protein